MQAPATHDRSLVMSRGKRFESARRLSKNADLQVKRKRRSGRWDASRLHVLQPVLQPVWPKSLSAWRFEGFNNPLSERTSRLSESRCCGRAAHLAGSGPLRPSVLLAACPFPLGPRWARGLYPAPCWESKGSGSLRPALACMIIVSAYTIGEGGGW